MLQWLIGYIYALLDSVQCLCVSSGALELFAELLQRFPNNVHLLTETAKVRAD